MGYVPFNYDEINVVAGRYMPSQVKAYNNKTFIFWTRALFQRACSTLQFDLPDEWQGDRKDFFYYCLFKYGYVAVFDDKTYGFSFQPCNLNGFDFYYQPTEATVANPKLNKTFKIHKDCELIKLTPDYGGVWDIIEYYAEKLSSLDNAINMSIINNKFGWILGARNKAAAEALKKIMDKINAGEPAVIYDSILQNDRTDKDVPFQLFDRPNLKQSYITTDQLMDFQTILNNFDTEIGIPVIPYQKKERMVTSEADSKIIDSTSRSVLWFETLTSSIGLVNSHFGSELSVKMRFNPDDFVVYDEKDEGGAVDE